MKKGRKKDVRHKIQPKKFDLMSGPFLMVVGRKTEIRPLGRSEFVILDRKGRHRATKREVSKLLKRIGGRV